MLQRTMEAVCIVRTYSLVLALSLLFILLSLVDCGPVQPKTVTSSKKENRCVYENKTYPSDHKFKPNPCTHCKCPKSGGEAICSVQDCFSEPNCLKMKKRKHECCGTCLLYGCQHSDGKIYHPGTSVPTGNHCEMCYCPKDGGATICQHTARCAPASCVNPIRDPGECCQRCPEGNNCWLTVNGRQEILQVGVTRTLDDCRQCTCPTGYIPSYRRGRGPEAFCTMGTC